MPDRNVLALFVIILLSWPIGATGQTEPTTPASPAETAALDPLGVWEGYNSMGYLLHIEIVGNPDASITALVQSYLYGPTSSPLFASQVWEVEPVGPTHTRFRILATSESVDAFWYGPDAVRLTLTDGSMAILARVLNTEAAAGGNPFAALPTVTPPPEAEGLVRALEGMWEGTSTPYEGAIPYDVTAEIRIVDVSSGQIIVTTSSPEGVNTNYYQVVSATADSLTVRTTLDYDSPTRIKFAESDRIELVSYGVTQMVLQRLSGL